MKKCKRLVLFRSNYQIDTPISLSTEKSGSRINGPSPLKYKSLVGIQDMGDQTLVDISIEDIDDPGFVAESTKMSKRKMTRYLIIILI